MNLIPNWRKWYRMFSVQALLVIGGIQGVAAVLSTETLAGVIPFTVSFTWGSLVASMTVTAAILGAVGRLVDQGAIVE